MTIISLRKEMFNLIFPKRVDYKLELLNKIHNLNSSLNMFMLNKRFFKNTYGDDNDYDYDLFDDIIDLFKKIRDCIVEDLLKSKLFEDCDVDDKRNCYTYNIPLTINNDFEYANYIKKSIIEMIKDIDDGCVNHILILFVNTSYSYEKTSKLIKDTKEKLINKILELEFKDITKTNAYFTTDDL